MNRISIGKWLIAFIFMSPIACHRDLAPASSSVSPDYGYAGQWGGGGSGNGQFQSPTGIVQDIHGKFYVTDTGNNRVEKFDSNGDYLGQWGAAGTGNGQFSGPTGIAIDSAGSRLYVTDIGNNRVQEFTTIGSYLGQWGGTGNGSGQFSYPKGLAVDAAGDVYVADSGNNRIQKFTSTGGYKTQWDGSGASGGKFKDPSWVAIDSSGFVYITDVYNYLIRKFKSDGTFINQWGGSGGLECYCFCVSSGPDGLTVDLFGHVFVCDGGNARVEEFTATGQGVTTFGNTGSSNSLLADNQNLVITLSGEIAVVDMNNNRIAFFKVQN